MYDFAEVSNNLVIDPKIIWLNYQDCHVGRSNTMLQKDFDILATNLNVLHHYFVDDLTKLFSDLRLVKFIDILAKSFFPYW